MLPNVTYILSIQQQLNCGHDVVDNWIMAMIETVKTPYGISWRWNHHLFSNTRSTCQKIAYLQIFQLLITTRCLKITEKVSFNIASEASYVYIFSGQKSIKNTKNGPFWRVFRKPEACGQTVLPDRSVLIGQKLVENAKIKKFKCDILGDFQTLWCGYSLVLILSMRSLST